MSLSIADDILRETSVIVAGRRLVMAEQLLTWHRDGCTSSVKAAGTGRPFLFQALEPLLTPKDVTEWLALGHNIEIFLLRRTRRVASPVEVVALPDMQAAQLLYIGRLVSEPVPCSNM